MIAQQPRLVEGILLVRNDGQLRDFCRDYLRHHGFRMIEAADGLEALLIAASRKRPIGLFITDSENARISGIQLAQMLQSISPQIRVVCLTGSGENARQAAEAQFRGLRKLGSTAAPQTTKVVVTSR